MFTLIVGVFVAVLLLAAWAVDRRSRQLGRGRGNPAAMSQLARENRSNARARPPLAGGGDTNNQGWP